jgi:DUF4097 and DUF4098 domain-containing protein YvlB
MAAAPPPFTTPPGNYDPRQQWKAQRRAAKEQRRAARAYYRGLRRPSFVRPLVLIIVGVIALLIETGRISGYDFWDWYVRWWPLLLIGLGVMLLGEWYLQRGDPYTTRTGAGGMVFLIVLLAGLAFAGHQASHSPFGWHFSDDDNDWKLHLFGDQHDADNQFDQPFGANGRLVIENPRGDVSIAASSDDRIHVSAHETVYSNERDAEKLLNKVRPALQVNGREATLKTPGLDRGTVDLTVQVPADTSIVMKTGRGNVAVNGLNGTIGVDATHGNVTLNKIGGSCTTHLSGGDFTAHALASSLSLSGRVEDASISDVTGKTTLDGDYTGEVNLSHIAAPITFHSSRTTFSVEKLDGDLSLDHQDLNVTNAKGRIEAATRSKNITFSGIGGPLDLSTSDGDINVDLSRGDGAINLRNRNGAIHLGLPPDHVFHVDASTRDGSVSSELTFSGKTERSERRLVGDTGSGGGTPTQVTLVAEHGDIEIRRAGENEEAPERPEAPEAPTQDGVPAVPHPPRPPHAPHLRVPRNTPEPQTSEQ